ncbi:16S rRNA (uracil(1498)-N(3))-methyltransferase [Malonomonas rubra]|uniref:16S rRNA (uracil(1498)-N(3))-methyltransferase n=1 Tax=Malonomonas rubra TaxID=57040 RepID=UPI0026EAA956|nr:16S rRNA (uracil(1498)-N(3))-methyltransferase [Malonomonas rubra]
MHRFFVPHEQFVPGQLVELPADVGRHLHSVLRLTAGAECTLFDGKGVIARAEVQDDFRVEILDVEYMPEPVCHLTLIQGLPKGEKLELVLQKGTELGVNQFLPTQMTRSVGRLKPDREQKRLQRWEKIVQEAGRQSGQAYLPQIKIEQSLDAALAAVEADLKLLLWEESRMPLDRVLPKLTPQKVSVIVGPEGGVTAEEAQQAEKAGYQPVSLGPRILRTETAGLAIVAILQYLYGDLTHGRCSTSTAFQGKDES